MSITYNVTVINNNTMWRINDRLHRENGPAIEYANGDKAWYLNGQNMTQEEYAQRIKKKCWPSGQNHQANTIAQTQNLYHNPVIAAHQGTNMSTTYKVFVDEKITIWHLNGQRHRENGPAVEHADGTKMWFLNGELHREDGPAIEYTDGEKRWYINGQLYRKNGPAIETVDGDDLWYLDGVEVSEEEYIQRTQPVLELTIADVEKLIGRSVKIIK